MATIEEVAEVLKLLTVSYPGRFKIGDTDEEVDVTVNTWLGLVGDIPGDVLKASAVRFVTTASHNFPPTIPEIRRQATEIRRLSMRIPTPEEAWGLVRNQMIEVGSYRTPHFDYPVLEQVVKRFGWISLCLSENEVADRAHFMRAYESALREDQMSVQQHPLVSQMIESGRDAFDRERSLPMDEEKRRAFDTGERIHFLSDHLKITG